MLTHGGMLTRGGGVRSGNRRCCQPASQQCHVAPSMSKHQPRFRAHTHIWHREKHHQRREREAGDESCPWRLPSKPSAVSSDGANPCSLGPIHLAKRETKGLTLFSFPVPPPLVSSSPQGLAFDCSTLTSKFPLFCWRSEHGHHQEFDQGGV